MTHDHAGHGSLDRVLKAADNAGLDRPYAVNIPAAGGTAYTITTQARRVQDSRSLYIDAASGRLLADLGYDRFGVGAKTIEWGVYTHQGTQYGQVNRIIMLLGCIGVWLLAISGLVMWWKRRPPNLSRLRLGGPPAPPRTARPRRRPGHLPAPRPPLSPDGPEPGLRRIARSSRAADDPATSRRLLKEPTP